MVNIVNAGTLGGGFRHYSGLLPVNMGSGNAAAQASVRLFHSPAANAVAIFRGDIVVMASAAIGTQGSADLASNISAPSASVVIGNGGGSGLGNTSMTPNIMRWTPGDTTSVIAGTVVGFGPITLYMAKNGFQYIPASIEAWVSVETDPGVEMYATMPALPSPVISLVLNSGIDVKANAGQQSALYGTSGVSLDSATVALTSTLPLRILNSGNEIGNDTLAAGFVARVKFNLTRHFLGTAAFVAT